MILNLDTEDDDQDTATNTPTSEKQRRINKAGLQVLGNGVVSMCALELNEKVPTKSRDAGTAKLFNASLPVSKAFAFFSIVHCGKNIPVEKHRDEAERLILLHSASQYCLSPASMQLIMQADNEERHAYISGLAKIAQQVTRYLLYCLTINYVCDKVSKS